MEILSEKFKNILKKIDETIKKQLSNVEKDASIGAVDIGSALSSLSGELRSLVPEGLALPNINLKSQLTSLSGITDAAQSSNLLSSITSSFGKELTAAGFNLDTLVSDAKTAIAGGKSLSSVIPNFEKDAAGLSAAFQKAIEVQLAETDPVKEAAAKFTANGTLTSSKSSASSAVIPVSETPPIKDTAKITIADKTTKITQQGITKELTTAKDASGGGKRKNYSKSGFATRPVNIGESFPFSSTIKLKYKPTKISRVLGTTEDGNGFIILPAPISNDDLKFYDTWTVSGNELTIDARLRKYDEIFVVYSINSTYDPHYKTA